MTITRPIPFFAAAALLLLSAPYARADDPFAPIIDDPRLPRVLLIGDSISIGYTLPVRELLKGKANVHRIPENGAFSQNGLAKIRQWLRSEKWDVIHFNFGIWDTHLLDEKGSILSDADELAGKTGRIRTPLPQYRANLEKLIDAMQATGAKLVWAATTPVMRRTPERLKDIPRYNAAAHAIMKRCGVLINDLNALASPRINEMQVDDGCHFNPQGSEILAGQVAQNIMAALYPDAREVLPKIRQTAEETIEGRRVLRLEHDCLPEWGYTEEASQYFYVVQPKEGKRGPLLVCLHSAGGTAESELAANVGYTNAAGDEFTGLVLNSDVRPTWWWGADEIKSKPQTYRQILTPTENRVLASVEWALQEFGLDRDRVYLRGISMGGSGTLGIGLARGDIFAAVMAGVPAGTHHAAYRLTNPATPSLPDSPPALVFFSHKDGWSRGMEGWLNLTRASKLALVAAWGPWGHINHYEMADPAAFVFPWMQIRRNEAYPAFTNATSDRNYPGLHSDSPDQDGQINAYFRWKVLRDRPEEFAIELRLVRQDELRGNLSLPEAATADVSLRRLQSFRTMPHGDFACSMERKGRLPQTLPLVADARGLVTVPSVEITAAPVTLRIKRR